MTTLLLKSVVGPYSHCVNLLDEILCHGPDSLRLVAGGRQISFNAAILCSLSPLLSSLVKQRTEDNCCSVHDDIVVFLPEMTNWKTAKHFKTFLSSGLVSNISRVEMEDLQNLLQMLDFNISCEVQPSPIVETEVEDEEKHFFVEIKYEDEDDSELLEKQDLFTRIQIERNNYEEIKNLIASGSSSSLMQDEDLEMKQGSNGTLPPHLNTLDKFTKDENKLSKRIKVMRNGKVDETIESVPLISAHSDFKCENRSNSFSTGTNKTLPEWLKRKLPNRKAKHSVFEITKNECSGGKTEKKNTKITQKGVQEKIRYSCSQCDYKSTRKPHLVRHNKAVHEGVMYPCTKCDYKVKQLSSLKHHIQSVHEGVRFPCKECDYKGTQLSLLKRHIEVIHEKIKYSCSQCDYKSKYVGELRWHIQSFHNGIRYECNKCDFKATRKSRLVRHSKTVHEGIYLHSCSKCDFKSNRLNRLKEHAKKAH